MLSPKLLPIWDSTPPSLGPSPPYRCSSLPPLLPFRSRISTVARDLRSSTRAPLAPRSFGGERQGETWRDGLKRMLHLPNPLHLNAQKSCESCGGDDPRSWVAQVAPLAAWQSGQSYLPSRAMQKPPNQRSLEGGKLELPGKVKLNRWSIAECIRVLLGP